MARDPFKQIRKSKPLHPRANQGLGLIILGMFVDIVGGLAAAGADDPAGGYAVVGAGGFVMIAGVIIYAASPSWIDWEPPAGYKGFEPPRRPPAP